MRIWTTNYRPFIMGGDVNAPVMADVPVSGPFDVGKGFTAYLAVSPSGRTFVAESITGAIVGSTIKQVCADIIEGEKSVMDKQIKDAEKLVKRAYITEPDELWKRLKTQ